MYMKLKYKAPVVLREVPVSLEEDMLVGSVVTKETTIETAGQQVETKSFNTEGFNQVWE